MRITVIDAIVFYAIIPFSQADYAPEIASSLSYVLQY